MRSKEPYDSADRHQVMSAFRFVSILALGLLLAGCLASPAVQEPGPSGQPSEQTGVPAIETPSSEASPTARTTQSPAGTQPVPSEETRRAATGSPAAQLETPRQTNAAPDDPGAARAVEAARKELAKHLPSSESEARLVQVEAVTWPDTSLGCPQPGMFYAQVLSPGYRLLLSAGGQVYEFHTDLEENVILCEGQSTVQLAISDLAARLKVEAETISTVKVQADEFPAGDLGCQDVKTTPRPIPAWVSGSMIVLEANGEQYLYHASRHSIAYCGKYP